LLAGLAVTVSPSFAQQPSDQVERVQTPVSAPPAAVKEPDYPDQRSFFIGITGLAVTQYSGPHIRGGRPAALSGIDENVNNLGKSSRFVLEGEAGIPITRTGMLYAEFERFHGDGVQVLTNSPFVDSIQFNKGDILRTGWHFQTGRIHLDDLLWPHKFPVARLRFKSIWGIRYISAEHEVISPTEDDVTGVPGSSFGVGNPYILYPEFGLGMEYALTKHTLFHVEGEGFAFPHHSVLTEGNATFSWRHSNLELMMGVKSLHFKSSPQKENYMVGTWTTPFVGFRWYF
jgi:hypothetical protein